MSEGTQAAVALFEEAITWLREHYDEFEFWNVGWAGMGRRFSGLILDWAGVLTTNMVEVIESFEAREGLPGGLFLSGWADPRGRELYRRLELGEITQAEWNEGFGALLGIPPRT